MLQLHRVAQALALFLGISTSVAAQTLTVGPDPALYDFTTIQAAVDAAVEGGTVRVAPGEYANFAVEKPLTVLGSGSASTVVRIPLSGSPFDFASGIRIDGVSTGEVRIGGFGIRSDNTFVQSLQGWVEVLFCDAPVALFDLELVVEGLHRGQRGFFNTFRARRLALSDCHVVGAADLPGEIDVDALFPIANIAFHGAKFEQSRVWATDCTFEGCATWNCTTTPIPLPGLAPASGVGVFAQRSEVYLGNCSVRGGSGVISTDICPPLPGGAGLRSLELSRVEVYTGPQSQIVGGFGADDAPGGLGAFLDGPTALFLGPGGTPEGGLNSQGEQADSYLLQAPQSTLIADIGIWPTLRATDALVSPGESSSLSLSGNPGAVQFTFLNTAFGSGGTALPLEGEAFLDPLTAIGLPQQVLDGAGLGEVTLQVPAEPALIDTVLLAQSAEFAGPGFLLANPIHFAVAP